jgi:hypothetical protein
LIHGLVCIRNNGHCNVSGKQCHGVLEHAKVQDVGWIAACERASKITRELKKLLANIFTANVPLNIIFDIHYDKQQKYIVGSIDHKSSDFMLVIMGRDQLITKRDLVNMMNEVKKETMKLDKVDAILVHKWIKLHIERVLLYNEHKVGPPAQDFILVLQSTWQLARMIELSDGKCLAMDSTFATNKYDVRLPSMIFLRYFLQIYNGDPSASKTALLGKCNTNIVFSPLF